MFNFFKKDEEISKLEEILRYKGFDDLSENLVFSTVYKIRENYKDFSKVKILTMSEKDFLTYIMDILKNDVYGIKFINNLGTKETYNPMLKHINIINNDYSLLKTLLYIKKANIFFEKDNILSDFSLEMSKILSMGLSRMYLDIFREFNSVTWIPSYDIYNMEKLLVYIFLWILGPNYIYKGMINGSLNMDNMFLKILKDYGIEYYFCFYEVLIKMLISEKYIESPKKFEVFKKQFLEKIDKKEERINNIPKEKEKREKEIRGKTNKLAQINVSLRDPELCQRLYFAYSKKNNVSIEEYKKRLIDEKIRVNEVLEDIKKYNEEKIFFIQNEITILKKSLEEFENKIKINSKKNKTKISEIISEEEKSKMKLEQIFLKIREFFEKEILKFFCKTLDMKTDCIKSLSEEKYIIYEFKILRYLMHFKLKEKSKVMDIEKFNKRIKNMQIMLLKKLFYLNKIVKITENEEINRVIILEILKTNIIDLEDIRCIVRKEYNKIYISILDKDIWQAETTITLKEDINVLVKENKKYKVFK